MASGLGTFEKVLRAGEGRRLKRIAEQAEYVLSLQPEFEKCSDDELRGKSAEFKQRLENGESLEELLFEAYAAIREAFRRDRQVELFKVQVMGGIVLHEGDPAHHLHLEQLDLPVAAEGLADRRIGLEEQFLERFSVLEPLLELGGLPPQLVVGALLELGLEREHVLSLLRDPLEAASLAGAQNLLESPQSRSHSRLLE